MLPFGSSFFFIGSFFSAATTAAKRVTSLQTPGLFVTESNTFRYWSTSLELFRLKIINLPMTGVPLSNFSNSESAICKTQTFAKSSDVGASFPDVKRPFIRGVT
jgi:hypothetical protein